MPAVQLVWSAQPGTNQLFFAAALNFATANSFVIGARASYQDTQQPAQFATIDNILNSVAVSVTLGVQVLTIPPFQRTTVPVPPAAQTITFAQASGSGIVNVSLFNYDPRTQDAIDFLAILRQVAFTNGQFCIDTGGFPNYAGAITPAPLALVDGAFVWLLPSASAGGGGVVARFNLNGLGALPIQWRGLPPFASQIQQGIPVGLILSGGVWNIVAGPPINSVIREFHSFDAGLPQSNSLVFVNATSADQTYTVQGGPTSIIVAECVGLYTVGPVTAGDFATYQIKELGTGGVGDALLVYGQPSGGVLINLSFPAMMRFVSSGFLAGALLRFRMQGKVATNINGNVMQVVSQRWSIKEIN